MHAVPIGLDILLLGVTGVFSGVLAGLLGVGGGTVLVPALVLLGRTAHVAIGTSVCAMTLTSFFGSIENWRAGDLDLRRALPIALGAVAGAPVGAALTDLLHTDVLAFFFGCLLLVTLYLVTLRQRLAMSADEREDSTMPAAWSLVAVGLAGGLLAGLFGVGGGIVMVPLQVLWLGEDIKTAARISLAVIVLTALSATVAHALRGNVEFLSALLLGAGGLLGVQGGARLLRKIPARAVRVLFGVLALVLALFLMGRSALRWSGASFGLDADL